MERKFRVWLDVSVRMAIILSFFLFNTYTVFSQSSSSVQQQRRVDPNVARCEELEVKLDKSLCDSNPPNVSKRVTSGGREFMCNGKDLVPESTLTTQTDEKGKVNCVTEKQVVEKTKNPACANLKNGKDPGDPKYCKDGTAPLPWPNPLTAAEIERVKKATGVQCFEPVSKGSAWNFAETQLAQTSASVSTSRRNTNQVIICADDQAKLKDLAGQPTASQQPTSATQQQPRATKQDGPAQTGSQDATSGTQTQKKGQPGTGAATSPATVAQSSTSTQPVQGSKQSAGSGTTPPGSTAAPTPTTQPTAPTTPGTSSATLTSPTSPTSPTAPPVARPTAPASPTSPTTPGTGPATSPRPTTPAPTAPTTRPTYSSGPARPAPSRDTSSFFSSFFTGLMSPTPTYVRPQQYTAPQYGAADAPRPAPAQTAYPQVSVQQQIAAEQAKQKVAQQAARLAAQNKSLATRAGAGSSGAAGTSGTAHSQSFEELLASLNKQSEVESKDSKVMKALADAPSVEELVRREEEKEKKRLAAERAAVRELSGQGSGSSTEGKSGTQSGSATRIENSDLSDARDTSSSPTSTQPKVALALPTPRPTAALPQLFPGLPSTLAPAAAPAPRPPTTREVVQSVSTAASDYIVRYQAVASSQQQPTQREREARVRDLSGYAESLYTAAAYSSSAAENTALRKAAEQFQRVAYAVAGGDSSYDVLVSLRTAQNLLSKVPTPTKQVTRTVTQLPKEVRLWAPVDFTTYRTYIGDRVARSQSDKAKAEYDAALRLLSTAESAQSNKAAKYWDPQRDLDDARKRVAFAETLDAQAGSAKASATSSSASSGTSTSGSSAQGSGLWNGFLKLIGF